MFDLLEEELGLERLFEDMSILNHLGAFISPILQHRGYDQEEIYSDESSISSLAISEDGMTKEEDDP